MNSSRLIRFSGAILLALIVSAPVAMAQTPEVSLFEVNEPTMVGDVTLQPGRYMIRVLPSFSDRHRVQVTDVDNTKVFTTVLTVPHPLEPNEEMPETRMVFYPANAGQPRALRTWFAPGTPREVGHDIVYEEERAKAFARIVNEPVVSYRGTITEQSTPEVRIVTPEARIEPYVEPRTTVRSEETTVDTTTRTSLPRTAGNEALIALLGAAALAGAVALRVANR